MLKIVRLCINIIAIYYTVFFIKISLYFTIVCCRILNNLVINFLENIFKSW